MKNLIKILLAMVFVLSGSQLNAAVDVVECENQQGERSFHQGNCPPGTNKVGGKRISTGGSSRGAADNSAIKATVYVVPECDSCDEVREFLDKHGISFEEKNVDGDLDLQTELREVAGALKAPTTVIGETTISGYNRSKLKDALTSAGYQPPAEN
jgi:glutaredoxin